MNCDNCLNLIDNKCKIGKQDILGTVRDESGKVRELRHECIFKNEKFSLSFDLSHNFAMPRIAVASYFIIRNYSDVEKLYDILNKEKDYGEKNLIGQFNVISTVSMGLKEIERLAKSLAIYNGKRLWNLKFIIDGSSPENFIVDCCELPYFLELTKPEDFATIQNFKFRCFSGPIPDTFVNIISVKYIRKQIEKLDAKLQEESTVQYNI